ncbi:MAG TPA: VOC family protein [Candidatus Eisenbacteria bacterium]
MHSRFDHLVITAGSLAAGTDWVTKRLGVTPGPGGQHPYMGTHNTLLRLGDDAYLEVLAIDPQAAPPDRPRWFALDDAAMTAEPRLAGWVVRVDDIEAVVALAPVPPGSIETMTRGDLTWRLTIPVDGRPPWGGALPILIEWPEGRHPTTTMTGSGCSLERLDLFHPDVVALRAFLDRIGLECPLVVRPGKSGLQAHVQTPSGTKVMSSGRSVEDQV